MVRVRRNANVMCHLMFGIVALAADQILRLVVMQSAAPASGNPQK
jgi:hypothetical protein